MRPSALTTGKRLPTGTTWSNPKPKSTISSGAVIIAAVLAAAAAVLTVLLVKRFRKRLHRRERELEELAAAYKDEA